MMCSFCNDLDQHNNPPVDKLGQRNGTAQNPSSTHDPNQLIQLPHQPRGEKIHYTYGLHRRCSSLTGECEYFPHKQDCHGDHYFCSMWRSVGFLMSFAIVMEGMTLIAYVVILAGGKQKRESGWKVLSGLHIIVALLQLAGMAIIVCSLTLI